MTSDEGLAGAFSVHGAWIRLGQERWEHITAGHPEVGTDPRQLLRAISTPLEIRAGREGTLMAVAEVGVRRWIVVIYREDGSDGFVVTAMANSRYAWMERRPKLWPS
jgi:hypothetical protein